MGLRAGPPGPRGPNLGPMAWPIQKWARAGFGSGFSPPGCGPRAAGRGLLGDPYTWPFYFYFFHIQNSLFYVEPLLSNDQLITFKKILLFFCIITDILPFAHIQQGLMGHMGTVNCLEKVLFFNRKWRSPITIELLASG